MTTTVAPRRTLTVRDAVTTRPRATDTRTSVTPGDDPPDTPSGDDGDDGDDGAEADAGAGPGEAPPVSERACAAGFPHPAPDTSTAATTAMTGTGHLDARTLPPPGPRGPSRPRAVHHTM
ncbi:hypothetical protein [Actinomadura harenae]|uniref:Uncharacterized protein n=1 Tax=Actinomadura harenae TaxID=2483351 RepID=A0A3M2L4R2_9ACTN|nr:hypothetical protein [Actinomadura harenae]RMI31513.1 hypothetical protein EBO15_42610 [Actinomadura harenae]